MGRLGQDNDTEFELSSNKKLSEIVQDPLNWDSDDKSYEVDADGKGVLRKINTDLEFGRDGYNYIRSLFYYGFNSTCTVTKRAKDTTKIGEDWRIIYNANLDLMAAKFKEGNYPRVSVPFTQGGLFDKIKARISDTYDLVNQKSADNIDITPLQTIREQTEGREIYRRSELSVEDAATQRFSVSGGDDDNCFAVPFTVGENGVNSDSDFINGTTLGANQVPFGSGTYQDGEVGPLLYHRAEFDKTIKLTGRVHLQNINDKEGTMYLDMVYYKTVNGVLKFQKKDRLSSLNTGVSLAKLDFSWDRDEILIPKDWSLAIVLHVNFSGSGRREYSCDFKHTKMVITIDDRYPATENLTLLPHEFFDRFLEKITGIKGLLKSNVFGRSDIGYSEDGEWSTLGVSSGFWARGFDLNGQLHDPNGDLMEPKQFNISLRDALDSYHVPEPMGWGIERKNGKEYFRIEKYSYFQQDFVGIRLGRTTGGTFKMITASNPEKSILSGDIFTKVQIGYENGGSDYKEVFGLYSPHGNAEYNTSLSKIEANPYVKLSKIRADLEGFELARVKQAKTNPDEDTEYDQSIFFRHLKKTGAGWSLRKWEDDFSSIQGIYSPSTTGNLLIVPLACLKRHGKIIGTGLWPDPYGWVTFISSNCLKGLELNGAKDGGPVQNKDLGKPYTNGFLLSFEGKVYQEVIDQIEGTTIVDNQKVPNWYGLFEVQVGTELLRGRLAKSSITGAGKHEIALING